MPKPNFASQPGHNFGPSKLLRRPNRSVLGKQFQVPGRGERVYTTQVLNLICQVQCPRCKANHSTSTTPKDGDTIRFQTTMHFHTHYSFCKGLNSAALECEVAKSDYSRRQLSTLPWYQQGMTTLMSSLVHWIGAPHVEFHAASLRDWRGEWPLVHQPTSTGVGLPPPGPSLADEEGYTRETRESLKPKTNISLDTLSNTSNLISFLTIHQWPKGINTTQYEIYSTTLF